MRPGLLVAHSTAAQAATYGGKWIEVSALDSRFQPSTSSSTPGAGACGVPGHTTPPRLSKPTTLPGPQSGDRLRHGDRQQGRRARGRCTSPPPAGRSLSRSSTRSWRVGRDHLQPLRQGGLHLHPTRADQPVELTPESDPSSRAPAVRSRPTHPHGRAHPTARWLLQQVPQHPAGHTAGHATLHRRRPTPVTEIMLSDPGQDRDRHRLQPDPPRPVSTAKWWPSPPM